MLHNRKPLIIAEGDYLGWPIDSLRPFPSELSGKTESSWPVSRRSARSLQSNTELSSASLLFFDGTLSQDPFTFAGIFAGGLSIFSAKMA